MPDWEYIHREFRRKIVTKILLWEEYRNVHPDGYQLTQFYELYNRWAGTRISVFFINEKVPEELQPFLRRPELRKSLRTSCYPVAKEAMRP